MTAPCQACGEDPDLGKRCPVTELRHVPASAGTCEHVIFDAGPVCSVRCSRPVGHPGGHTVQWNEDDQRAVEAYQRVCAATPPAPESHEMAALREENARLRAALDEVAAILLLLK